MKSEMRGSMLVDEASMSPEPRMLPEASLRCWTLLDKTGRSSQSGIGQPSLRRLGVVDEDTLNEVVVVRLDGQVVDIGWVVAEPSD